MKFKKIIFVGIFLLAILAIGAVGASDVNSMQEEISIDNQTQDLRVTQQDVLETDDGTFTALQYKINNAAEGSTITLENDYAYDDGFDSEGIIVDKDLTINGNGHTLNGLSKSRIFKMKDSDFYDDITHKVTLNNIKFINGYGENNGAISAETTSDFKSISEMIYCNWNLIVNNCDFSNNHAQSHGGALYSTYLTITDSTFNNNSAGDYGGAVVSSDAKFTRCNFTNNKADHSDGVAIWGDVATINNCIFTKNEAVDCGGAVYTRDATEINSCTFNSNKAKNGGAAYSWGGNFKVSNSEFNSNYASNDGGAIHYSSASYYYSSSSTSTTIYDSLIQESIFTDNNAENYGGAVYNKPYEYGGEKYCMNILKSTFEKNKASSNSDYDDVYGASTSDCIFKKSSTAPSDTSSGSSKTVKKLTPKLTAKAKTFKKSIKTKKYTVSLKTNKNKAMKNTKVTLKVNKKTYTAKTNKKGVATFKITKLTKKGKYSATIKYAGSKNYNSKTVKVKITVK